VHQTDSNWRHLGLLVALAAMLSLMLAACSSGTTAPSSSAAAGSAGTGASGAMTVTLQNFAFSPSTLNVPVGTKVTFTNKDQTEHTATNGKDGIRAANALFDLSLKAGASDSFTFDKAGTYDVTCRFHPAMHMTITVG
jgi:plastocyanin